MSLYHKYRPNTFDEVVGNGDAINYLKEVLADDKNLIPNVFLLHGPTGCGKTTIARIIANELECSKEDFNEINTANFRGIDSVREIIRNSKYHSLHGDVRVWLIDESHKLTGDAQNALLKLLEDPPAHSYFILCTTEPEKLLNTVKGRCMQLQMKPLNENQMFTLLRRVVKEEGQKITKSVYEQITQDSLGLPRNAIQILEKVLRVPAERQLEMAQQSAVEYSDSIELCRILIGSRPGWKQVRSILKGLKDQEPETIRRHVIGYASSVLLGGDHERAALVIEEFYEPFYNTGFPGLVFACYSVVKT